MANLIIGGPNLIQRAATTLTAGAEVAGFEADNLKIDHPAEIWRTGDLTSAGAFVKVDLAAPEVYDLVAALYSSGTPHRNLLRNTKHPWNTGDYTATNSTHSQLKGVLPGAARPAMVVNRLTDDATSGVHTLHQEFSFVNTLLTNTTFTVSIYLRTDAAVHAQLRVHGTSSANYARMNCDLSSDPPDTIESTAVGGSGFTVVSSSVTNGLQNGANNNWARFSLTFTVASSLTEDTLRFVLYVLDGSFTESYSGSSDAIEFCAPQLEIGTAATGPDTTAAAIRGACWDFITDESSTFVSDPTKYGYESMMYADRAREFYDAIGYTHAWRKLSTFDTYQHLLFKFDDEDNASSQYDLGNLYVGRAFQPTKNFKPATLTRRWEEETDPNAHYAARGKRFRTWSLELHYLSSAEAEGELNDILMHVGRSRGALVIVDPDETTYGQTRIIYGRITGSDISHVGYNTTLGGQQWRVSLQIREIVP